MNASKSITMGNMNTSLQTIDIRLPVHSLEAYLHYVNQVPMLTQEEEYELAVRLQKDNDLPAAKRLIFAHLRYVVRVAKGYLGYGLPLADLVQEGNIGLMKAVRRFNPEMGVRLVTFAMHWIKAEIHEYILRNWRIVKVATTKAQRKLFFNLRNLKKRLGWMTQQEVDDIAKDLKVKPETVREMEMRLASSDASFDAILMMTMNIISRLPVILKIIVIIQRKSWKMLIGPNKSGDKIYHALDQLDERSQDIIRTRWLDEEKLTLQDLADKYQISAERVRQLEKNAMLKLRAAFDA